MAALCTLPSPPDRILCTLLSIPLEVGGTILTQVVIVANLGSSQMEMWGTWNLGKCGVHGA